MKTAPIGVYEEEVCPTEAARHVACARHSLTELRQKLGRWVYPELQEAISELEVALNILTVKTGGML